MGASFLIIVDDVARLVTTSEIPIGILTAVIGAPVFIYLILRGGVRDGGKNA
jgi:iron complex transport system permease protein